MSRLIALSAIAALLVGCGIPYSDGTRTGTVQKVSKKGLIWKTYEGELVQDGFRFNGNTGSGSNIWKFSAKDQAVADAVDLAAEKGLRVKLTYEQVINPAPWTASTGYIVTKVETAKQ